MDSQQVRVELLRQMGRNGGFATKDEPLWRAFLVGINGKRQCLHLDVSHGWRDQKYALQAAKQMAAMLGCPIIERDETLIRPGIVADGLVLRVLVPPQEEFARIAKEIGGTAQELADGNLLWTFPAEMEDPVRFNVRQCFAIEQDRLKQRLALVEALMHPSVVKAP